MIAPASCDTTQKGSIKLTDDIVMDGACIGCGLCAGISEGAIEMAFTPEMRERPIIVGEPTQTCIETISKSCPGLATDGLTADEAGADAQHDQLWGYTREAHIAWAKDRQTRFRASTGGVLSALSAFLLESGEVDFVLHVGPDPKHPARSVWKISQTPEDTAHTGGSRYGPAAPLAGLPKAKELTEAGAQKFAFIGKPCDISAIKLLAQREEWLSESLAYRLTIMCGGASEFEKTASMLSEWGIEESELSELRYRGFGNPGPTTARTKSGEVFSKTYQEQWEDESKWALQHRCKICPDAIGMAADLVSFDCWPGGGPTGEDEGFNAVITRTPRGSSLLKRAIDAGKITLGKAIDHDDFASFQPHQERKRRAVWARLLGQRSAGKYAPAAISLHLEDLARENSVSLNLQQARGTKKRLLSGRGLEPRPVTTQQTTGH